MHEMHEARRDDPVVAEDMTTTDMPKWRELEVMSDRPSVTFESPRSHSDTSGKPPFQNFQNFWKGPKKVLKRA